jgi:hypothetical protein
VQTSTDRNGNVHTFCRDVLGRLMSDTVTTLDWGIDDRAGACAELLQLRTVRAGSPRKPRVSLGERGRI